MFWQYYGAYHPTGDPCSCCRHYAIQREIRRSGERGRCDCWIGEHEIKAPLTGMVRGLLNDGLAVVGGFKIGDIDPRGETADFTSVSDKARAIGGGVLEALMMLMHQGVKATKEVLEVA